MRKNAKGRWMAQLAIAALFAAGPVQMARATDAAAFVDSSLIDALPVPDKSDMLIGQRPYQVGPFDRLIIDVFNVPGLTLREVQADASGRISFPLVGIVEVLGMTPGEIEILLRAKLKEKYIRDPEVSVNLKESVSQVVTVFGEVKKPGLYPVLGRMTLLMALAKAEGTTEFSRLSNIIVYRTVKGQRYAALYNAKAIKRGQYQDPEIYPSDVVIVDDSQARRIFKDFLSFTPLLGPIILAASR